MNAIVKDKLPQLTEVQRRLSHVRESIDFIEEYLGTQRDFDSYIADRMLCNAVERELSIIGEALTRILRCDPEIAITNVGEIKEQCVYVTYNYDAIDELVWAIITRHLPLLRAEVEKLLG